MHADAVQSRAPAGLLFSQQHRRRAVHRQIDRGTRRAGLASFIGYVMAHAMHSSPFNPFRSVTPALSLAHWQYSHDLWLWRLQAHTQWGSPLPVLVQRGNLPRSENRNTQVISLQPAYIHACKLQFAALVRSDDTY